MSSNALRFHSRAPFANDRTPKSGWGSEWGLPQHSQRSGRMLRCWAGGQASGAGQPTWSRGWCTALVRRAQAEFTQVTGIALPENLSSHGMWEATPHGLSRMDDHGQACTTQARRVAGWLRVVAANPGEYPLLLRMMRKSVEPLQYSPANGLDLYRLIELQGSPGAVERRLGRVIRRADNILRGWDLKVSWEALARAMTGQDWERWAKWHAPEWSGSWAGPLPAPSRVSRRPAKIALAASVITLRRWACARQITLSELKGSPREMLLQLRGLRQLEAVVATRSAPEPGRGHAGRYSPRLPHQDERRLWDTLVEMPGATMKQVLAEAFRVSQDQALIETSGLVSTGVQLSRRERELACLALADRLEDLDAPVGQIQAVRYEAALHCLEAVEEIATRERQRLQAAWQAAEDVVYQARLRRDQEALQAAHVACGEALKPLQGYRKHDHLLEELPVLSRYLRERDQLARLAGWDGCQEENGERIPWRLDDRWLAEGSQWRHVREQFDVLTQQLVEAALRIVRDRLQDVLDTPLGTLDR